MRKTILIVGLVVIVLGGLGVGVAFAQGRTPPYVGSGPMVQNGYGWMHDYVEQALAEKLGVTEEQVEDQLAAGQPMYQVALDNGIKPEDLAAFMNEVHKDAFANAVKDGVMAREQADWMLLRMQTGGYGNGGCPMNGANGFGRGGGMGDGMMRGFGWQNQRTNP